MEAVALPSPSSFLKPPKVQSSPTVNRNGGTKKKSATPSTVKAIAPGTDGATKPKQSKSRNGCVTCKAKRLKCDETKPTCQQCFKRSVECGGYKKDYKWRSFEEATFTAKPTAPKIQKSTTTVKPNTKALVQSPDSPTTSEASGSTVVRVSQPLRYAPPDELSPPTTDLWAPHTSTSDSFDFSEQSSLLEVSQNSPDSSIHHARVPSSSTIDTFDAAPGQANATTPSSFSSSRSPQLTDLLNAGTDLNAPPDYIPYRHIPTDTAYQLGSYEAFLEDPYQIDEEVEEIVRQPESGAEAWVMRLPSPSPSLSSSSSSTDSARFDPLHYIYSQPKLHAGSPEMLMRGFDSQTCGILSVKDGPTENPWRTLVWPLASESPALYHAISSMTAFHTSKVKPALKVEGIEHMRKSVAALRQGIHTMQIGLDVALATTLALAFSESWDIHVSTGIDHIRGARTLVKLAMDQQRQNALSGQELMRFKFLYNTWIYMDVIARLTNNEEDKSDIDLDTSHWPLFEPFGTSSEVDPLMGCASTLFPLIGRVANLVRKVRNSTSNSINIVSQANELKTQIEMWKPPPFFEPPEDPASEIRDSLQTAEAYRWATLLFLHQAVPEIPSQSAAQLAKKVLVYLATVPQNSRTIIVQIYPLLAAGCEAESLEDRTWVEQRWIMMTRRMLIGNIDRCLEVAREVWTRRDEDAAKKLKREQDRAASKMLPYLGSPVGMKRRFSTDETADPMFYDSADSYESKRRATEGGIGVPLRASTGRRASSDFFENLEFERTVRGRLHWVGVMREWKWEVLLG